MDCLPLEGYSVYVFGIAGCLKMFLVYIGFLLSNIRYSAYSIYQSCAWGAYKPIRDRFLSFCILLKMDENIYYNMPSFKLFSKTFLERF